MKRSNISLDDILIPIPGTVYYDTQGHPVGVWGRELPVVVHVRDGDNIRPANRAERRLARRWWPSVARAEKVMAERGWGPSHEVIG